MTNGEKIKSGMYWLAHHIGPLVEYVWDEKERRNYIDTYKPEGERAIRQLCFQPVKGELPEEVIKAGEALAKARKVWCEGRKVWAFACKARKAWDEALTKAHKAWVKADSAWVEADKAFCKVVSKHITELEAQYAREYPAAAKHWDGKRIIFPKPGMYWLCHHKGPLVEYVWDEKERRNYIDVHKPESERAIRQLCFQSVKGELPEEVIKAGEALAKARRAWDEAYKAWIEKDNDGTKYKAWIEAYKAWIEAHKAWDEAHQAWYKADMAFCKAVSKHKAELEAQYTREYPAAAKHWDGERIIFPNSKG